MFDLRVARHPPHLTMTRLAGNVQVPLEHETVHMPQALVPFLSGIKDLSCTSSPLAISRSRADDQRAGASCADAAKTEVLWLSRLSLAPLHLQLDNLAFHALEVLLLLGSQQSKRLLIRLVADRAEFLPRLGSLFRSCVAHRAEYFSSFRPRFFADLGQLLRLFVA